MLHCAMAGLTRLAKQLPDKLHKKFHRVTQRSTYFESCSIALSAIAILFAEFLSLHAENMA